MIARDLSDDKDVDLRHAPARPGSFMWTRRLKLTNLRSEGAAPGHGMEYSQATKLFTCTVRVIVVALW
jgi:hypothetical protein